MDGLMLGLLRVRGVRSPGLTSARLPSPSKVQREAVVRGGGGTLGTFRASHAIMSKDHREDQRL
jgi:hypothetical protein